MNEFKSNKIYKEQRNFMQNLAMIISGLYTIVPIYAMMLGFMSMEMSVFLMIPAVIAFCVTLTLNR